ncbi:solute carrier family 2, facilitated glucose transporter member 1 [Octopus sinensis]|uniref:Solute carrier family 2, facilitated glucose transporter member 1 n=1 Tax=Octopus sinensis TaxID=2607531 RepID=A0A6P7T6P6_9MOLL|nr:solute carrier family 2, facilitated glucose transporter member 1 [Octopus sinensis]XP_029645497.1 solute carrier family 2, facilitated glucose transporter member 1 [Octopus sinensis]XP_036364767.1 solute carrier family 2, facilitated glucose transporter member 1 [Octopus sinensis]
MTTISSEKSSVSGPDDTNPQAMNTSSDKLQPSRSRLSFLTAKLFLSIVASAMGSFMFGYGSGVINSPQGLVKDFINATVLDRNGEPSKLSHLNNYWSLIVAIFAVGGMIGGLSGGVWADFFGRKRGIMLNCPIGVLGSVLIVLSKTCKSFEMIIIGRLVLGVNCGLTTVLTPMYLSEIAPANIRGALGVVHQLSITLGVLISQVLGFPELMGTESSWPILLGLTFIPAAIQLPLLIFCPESPRFLLISRNEETRSREVLMELRGNFDVELDIEDMKHEQRMCESEPKISIWELMFKSELRRPLVIGMVMQLSQQCSGILAVLYYSHSLFTMTGMSDNTANHADSSIGAVLVVMTFISIPLMESTGRRALHLIGLMGMFILSIFLNISLVLSDTYDAMQVVSIVIVILFVGFFSIGPGSIPWLIVAELFSQGARSSAMSVCVMINWLSNFLNAFTFPYVEKGLKHLSFLPFTILLLLFWIFTYMFLPETKDKTFQQISEIFSQKTLSSQSKSNGVAKENSHLVGFRNM